MTVAKCRRRLGGCDEQRDFHGYMRASVVVGWNGYIRASVAFGWNGLMKNLDGTLVNEQVSPSVGTV